MLPDRILFSDVSPGDPKEGDIQLYSIIGWFSPSEGEEGNPTAFAGYFQLDPSTDYLHNGQLIDVLGSSIIEGRLHEKRELVFKKKYRGRKNNIDYSFKYNNGIWIGIYEGDRDVGKGTSECLTHLVTNNASQLVCGDPRETFQT